MQAVPECSHVHPHSDLQISSEQQMMKIRVSLTSVELITTPGIFVRENSIRQIHSQAEHNTAGKSCRKWDRQLHLRWLPRNFCERKRTQSTISRKGSVSGLLLVISTFIERYLPRYITKRMSYDQGLGKVWKKIFALLGRLRRIRATCFYGGYIASIM